MNIYDALARLEAVQKKLEITRPFEARIKWVHTLPPDGRINLNDMPCFINTAKLLPAVFSPALLQRRYTVRMQLFAGNVSQQSSLAAIAFEEELIRALALNVTLDGSVTLIREIRATDGTEGLVRLEWNGLGYSGLDYEMDVWMSEQGEYAP